MKPDFDWNRRAAIENSELDWGRVALIPTSHLRPQVSTSGLAARIHEHTLSTIVPSSNTHPHYAFARETDSAIEVKEEVANKPKPSEALAQLGRLAEPALVRVKYFATNATVRNEAGLLLNELHQRWSTAGK